MRSFGKRLPMPNHYYDRLSRWHELAMMKGSSEFSDLRELARAAIHPGPIEDFIALVEFDLGFALYRAVSDAKMALSSEDRVEFRFSEEDITITSEITRSAFEDWIREDLTRISGGGRSRHRSCRDRPRRCRQGCS